MHQKSLLVSQPSTQSEQEQRAAPQPSTSQINKRHCADLTPTYQSRLYLQLYNTDRHNTRNGELIVATEAHLASLSAIHASYYTFPRPRYSLPSLNGCLVEVIQSSQPHLPAWTPWQTHSVNDPTFILKKLWSPSLHHQPYIIKNKYRQYSKHLKFHCMLPCYSTSDTDNNPATTSPLTPS